jgi:hypothetical protein
VGYYITLEQAERARDKEEKRSRVRPRIEEIDVEGDQE